MSNQKIYLDDVTAKFVKNFNHVDFIVMGDNFGSYTREFGQTDDDFANEIYDAVYDIARIDKIFVREISLKLN